MGKSKDRAVFVNYCGSNIMLFAVCLSTVVRRERTLIAYEQLRFDRERMARDCEQSSIVRQQTMGDREQSSIDQEHTMGVREEPGIGGQRKAEGSGRAFPVWQRIADYRKINAREWETCHEPPKSRWIYKNFNPLERWRSGAH